MDVVYTWIITDDNCCQNRLLFPLLFISQFVYPVGGKGIGQRGLTGGIVALARYVIHFIRKHENLV